jgi:anti-sigma regulatory factor (Ser/Thr protein kinase)
VAYPAAGVRLPPSATPADLTMDVTRLAALPLGPLPGSAKVARDFAISVLRTWGLPELLPDVSLIVSELVTNAVRHGLRGMAAEQVASPSPDAAAPIRLAMLRQGCRLRCEVTDPSEVMPVPLEADEDAEIGRGLHLVAALSWDWGATLLAGGGKCVWAILHGSK